MTAADNHEQDRPELTSSTANMTRPMAVAEATGGRLLTAGTVFEAVDSDGNRVLDMEEVRQVGNHLGFTFDQAELESIFHKMDVDGNGTVDMNEFHKWWEEDGQELADLADCSNLLAALGQQAAEGDLSSGRCPMTSRNPITKHVSSYNTLPVSIV